MLFGRHRRTSSYIFFNKIMSAKRNIFLTGGTGFLGSNLLKLILEEDCAVYLLIRGANQDFCKSKINNILKRIFDSDALAERYAKRINLICGVIEKSTFGIHSGMYDILLSSIDEIFHCAAIIGFNISLDQGRQTNVQGTHNILQFAQRCKKIKKLNYISTTFVAGTKEGLFSEKDFSVGQAFNNYYEQTKFEAEQLVRNNVNDRYDTLIFRPSIVVGNYLTGETSNFEMFYKSLRLFSKEIFTAVPADPQTLHNLVPVDVAAKAIFVLSTKERGNGVYHITSPNNTECGYFMDVAANYFKYINPLFIPLEKFDMAILTSVQKRMISELIPYFNYRTIFNSEITQKIMEKHGYSCPKVDQNFYERLFEYCQRVRFIRGKINDKTQERIVR